MLLKCSNSAFNSVGLTKAFRNVSTLLSSEAQRSLGIDDGLLFNWNWQCLAMKLARCGLAHEMSVESWLQVLNLHFLVVHWSTR